MHYESIRSKALVLLAAGSLLSLACGDDSSPPPAADSSGGNTSTSTGSSVSATSMPTTAGTTVAADSTTGMADGSFLDPSTGTTGRPDPQPNGSPCKGEGDCESEFCYENPLMGGGVCSECLTDEDCGEGTCSVDFMLGYAVCADGALGLMCNTDEGCMDELVCAELINTGGMFPLDFCSECRNDDVPCTDPTQTCSPIYDLQNFAGYFGCVDPGSVENGGGCPVNGMVGDDTVCNSMRCGVATLFGPIVVGVCGECLDDADCVAMGLTTCQAPEVDLMAGITPATCI